MQLVIEDEQGQARSLIQKAQIELEDEASQRKMIEFIVLYKFSD